MQVQGQVSIKHKIVAKGVMEAELNEFLKRELRDCGYSHFSIRKMGKKSVVVIHASKMREARGEDSIRLKMIKSLIQQRFGFNDTNFDVFVTALEKRETNAAAQCESLRFKLESGLPVRRAAYSIMRVVMDAGALGIEIAIAGKLRGMRDKTTKYTTGIYCHIRTTWTKNLVDED
eukprot:gnl/Chilomastix_caulleri/8725.p1 GENE.gnl/Chilomastix_caulleri/8725~~gnl/Chilomastix_caulleri/8725.p1  ORF type:complete len:175 (+),score=40.34 gnl/Chilomastix_caulleri/8725:44-568(+)